MKWKENVELDIYAGPSSVFNQPELQPLDSKSPMKGKIMPGQSIYL